MKIKEQIEARYPISASLKYKNFVRLKKLRECGWKISRIFLLGIETAEKQK